MTLAHARQAHRRIGFEVGDLEGPDEVDAREVRRQATASNLGHRSAMVTTRYGRWTKLAQLRHEAAPEDGPEPPLDASAAGRVAWWP